MRTTLTLDDDLASTLERRGNSRGDAQLNGSGPVALPWPSLLGLLRPATNPRVLLPA